MAPLKALEKNLLLLLPGFWYSPEILGVPQLWVHHSDFYLQLYMLSFLLVSVSVSSQGLLLKIPVIEFGAHSSLI